MTEYGRTFRMGVFNALDVLWDTSREHPGVPLQRLAVALLHGRASTASFDYPAAMSLIDRVPALLAVDAEERSIRLRTFLSLLLTEIQPGWRYLLSGGRELVAQHLDPDVLQVFRASGLYESASNDTVRQWWDRMASTMRLVQDEARHAQGRSAEIRTLVRERQRLANAGRSDLEPHWSGFEDCTLGYDIRSFSLDGATPRPKFIEVKSSASSALRFFLSRNEWEVAERHRHDYWVHLWEEETERLIELDYSTLAGHIPVDQGQGTWMTIQVRLD